MAKKLVEVLLDLEYPDGKQNIEYSSISMASEVIKIIEAGAAENDFDVSHTSAGIVGVEFLFELTEQ